MVLSSAAAIAVAVLVVVMQGQHTSTSGPLATGSNSSGAPTNTGNPDKQGRSWSYHHLQVIVPASWKADQLSCGTPNSNTVLIGNHGGGPLCDFRQPSGITVVRLQTTDDPTARTYLQAAHTPSSLDGRSALRGTLELPDVRTVQIVVVPSISAVLSVEAPTNDPLAQQ